MAEEKTRTEFIGFVHTDSGYPTLGADDATMIKLSDPEHKDNETALAAGWDLRYNRLHTMDEYHTAMAKYLGVTLDDYHSNAESAKKAAEARRKKAEKANK